MFLLDLVTESAKKQEPELVKKNQLLNTALRFAGQDD